MSTLTSDDAARLLAGVLTNKIQIFDVGEPETVGHNVVRGLAPVGEPIPGLVQGTNLANAVESRTDSVYSVKVARGTPLAAGQAVRVLSCDQEPSLVGQVLLLDKVSQNGAALIRKAVASTTQVVNQEGKEGIST